MQPNRKEIETIARVRGMNHEALRIIKKIKLLEEPEDGVFRDRILVNYERMRLVMERVGLLLEVRLYSKDLDFGEYLFQKVEQTWIFWKSRLPSWIPLLTYGSFKSSKGRRVL